MLSPDLVSSWASQQGVALNSIEEAEVGAFTKTPAIHLELGCGTRGYLPRVPAQGHPPWEKRRAAREQRAALWSKVEWFEPLWIPQKRVAALLKDVKHGTRQRAIEMFNYHASTIYTIPFEAVCVAQLIPQTRSLEEFQPLVREAFLAFYAGYRASSIAALIPLLEGAIRRIATFPDDRSLTTVDAVDKACNGAIRKAASIYFGGAWVPGEYSTTGYLFPLDERVFAFETLRRWLRESFFEHTGAYDGATWLNRHFFAHGMSTSWHQSSNFTRLIVALTTLGVVESWSREVDGVSLFFPAMDDGGRLLWQEALFRAEAQGILNQLAEKRYHKHGRLVPEFPTDDGVLLRRAILSNDCIRDLVRPLRNAGWNVEIDEPEESGLYVTLRATCGDTRFGLALLYSCATANETYKALSEQAEVILYRGSPYKQNQYARGIEAHVGPVTGWQPPVAPRDHES